MGVGGALLVGLGTMWWHKLNLRPPTCKAWAQPFELFPRPKRYLFYVVLVTPRGVQGLLLALCWGITPGRFRDHIGCQKLNLHQLYARQMLYHQSYCSGTNLRNFSLATLGKTKLKGSFWRAGGNIWHSEAGLWSSISTSRMHLTNKSEQTYTQKYGNQICTTKPVIFNGKQPWK